MELLKSDIVSILAVIKLNYSYAFKDADEYTFEQLTNVWFYSLKRYSHEVVGQAFELSLESSKTPPTLADIIEQIKKMLDSLEPSVCDLWAELKNIIDRTARLVSLFKNTLIESNGLTQGANAKVKVNEIYEQSNPSIKRYLSNVNTLIDLAGLTLDELNYEKQRFFKIVPEIKKQILLKDRITANTELISNINEIKLTLEYKTEQKS